MRKEEEERRNLGVVGEVREQKTKKWKDQYLWKFVPCRDKDIKVRRKRFGLVSISRGWNGRIESQFTQRICLIERRIQNAETSYTLIGK